MKIPFVQTRQRDFAIEELQAGHIAAAAFIHREDFSRPWSEDEFDGLMSQDTVFGFVARETGRSSAGPVGFVLARLAAEEGEILTIAVARSHRRLGLGWKLLDAVLRALHRERAGHLFLEVDETNTAAIALYKRLGFVQVGKRPGYYAAEGSGIHGRACHAARSPLALPVWQKEHGAAMVGTIRTALALLTVALSTLVLAPLVWVGLARDCSKAAGSSVHGTASWRARSGSASMFMAQWPGKGHC